MTSTSNEKGREFGKVGLQLGSWRLGHSFPGGCVPPTLVSETPEHTSAQGPSTLRLSGKFRLVGPELAWD